MRSFLRNLLGRSSTSAASDGWSDAVRQLISRCPNCEREVQGHDWAIVGSARLSSAEDDALKAAFTERDWRTATNLHVGDPLADYREIAALRCPSTNRLAALEILSYAEAFLDDELTRSAKLSAEDSEALNVRIPPESWKRI